MELAVLGSGSAGNCTIARAGETALLVDCGLSAKQIELRLASRGIRPEDLAGILLTHEHADHARGVKVFSRKYPVPVYCNAATARALGDGLPPGRTRLFQTGHRFEIGTLTVEPFAVPHDAVEPVAFRLAAEAVACAVVTDLGYVTRLVLESLRGITALVIEANYDENLLQQDSKRPWSVKQRIHSRHGHLSNADAAALLAALPDLATLNAVILCHLSRDCNSPALAEKFVRPCLPASASLLCASQNEPTPWVGAKPRMPQG